MQRSLLSVLIAFTFFCAGAQVAKPVQSVKFYLTPSISGDLLSKKGTLIKDFLEKETGISIDMLVPGSYDELVDNFGTNSPCFAMMSSQSYVVANHKHKAQVKLRTVRFGHSVYYGMIVTNASLKIKSISDLQGKSIAYTDELSTSGYLYPKKLLEKNNVKPGKETFAKKHDEVVRLVYEGKVDAGAAFYSPPAGDGSIRDARSRLKEKYPDIENKVVILVKTDPIPNDPIVFSNKFDPETAHKLCLALIKFSQDPKGKQVLVDLYGTETFVRASDADYNSLRQVVKP